MRTINISGICPKCGTENTGQVSLDRVWVGWSKKIGSYKPQYQMSCYQCNEVFSVTTPAKERLIGCLISLFFILLPAILLFVLAVLNKHFFF